MSQPRTDADPTATTVNADTTTTATDDRASLESHIERWERDLQPRDEAERSYLRGAAELSWQLECIAREIPARFDPSPAGERLRRYQLSLRRELRMTVDAFWKTRRQAEKHSGQADAAKPAPRRRDALVRSKPLDASVTGVIPRVKLDRAWTEADEDRARLEWLEAREAPLRQARLERYLREEAARKAPKPDPLVGTPCELPKVSLVSNSQDGGVANVEAMDVMGETASTESNSRPSAVPPSAGEINTGPR